MTATLPPWIAEIGIVCGAIVGISLVCGIFWKMRVALQAKFLETIQEVVTGSMNTLGEKLAAMDKNQTLRTATVESAMSARHDELRTFTERLDSRVWLLELRFDNRESGEKPPPKTGDES